MAIIQGKDNKETSINNYLGGLYYYLLNVDDFSEINASLCGYTNTIENICFNPFIDKNDVTVNEIKFDMKKYQGSVVSDSLTPKVWRIIGFNQFEKSLYEYDIFGEYENYNSNYESKLLLFPFKYYMLTDYINPPLIIKPQLMKYNSNNKWEFKVKCSLSQFSKYLLYPFKYKSDIYGNIEGIVNNNPLLFPVSSNQYSSWLTSQGNTFNASNNLALMENDLSLKQGQAQNLIDTKSNTMNGIFNTLGSLFTGNITGSMSSSLNTGINLAYSKLNNQHMTQTHNLKEYEVQTMALARKQDLINTPRAIKTIGNDSIFSIETGNKKVDLIEFSITNQRKTRLSNYFARYGYKVNDYTIPNFKSRKYFNFVKTIDCNIDSANIPHDDLLYLQEIFNSGVTFWHIDNGATVKNYNVNNEEI